MLSGVFLKKPLVFIFPCFHLITYLNYRVICIDGEIACLFRYNFANYNDFE